MLIISIMMAAIFFIAGFFTGVIIEDKNLLKWFDKELDLIEKRYKRKYGEDGSKEDDIL